MKYTISQPINYLNKPESLVLTNYNIDKETRFNNMQFLQDINYAYISILHSRKFSSFASIDYILSLRNKLDVIFDDFNKRKDIVIAQIDNQKWKPFQGYEMFKDFTAIELLDLATQILVQTVLIVAKSKGYYDQHDKSNRQNMDYFIGLLVCFFYLRMI
jgi:hypothetical protein